MDLEEAQESSRGVRKAPASDAMDEGPNAKRQMASLPFDSTMVPMDVSPNQSAPIPSADDVLVDMIRRSGAKTPAEVAEFCRVTGIPLSRMFKLDLMRQLQQQNPQR